MATQIGLIAIPKIVVARSRLSIGEVDHRHACMAERQRSMSWYSCR